jgi:hypothetical protein
MQPEKDTYGDHPEKSIPSGQISRNTRFRRNKVLPYASSSPSPKSQKQSLSKIEETFYNMYRDSPKDSNPTKALYTAVMASKIDPDYIQRLIHSGADTSVKYSGKTLVEHLETRIKKCMEKKRSKVAAEYLKCKRMIPALQDTVRILEQAPIIRPSGKNLGPIAYWTP